MQRHVVVALAAAGVLLLFTIGDVSARKPRHQVAASESQFGLDMYALMSSRDTSSNLFFSPLSICTALAMTYAGSSGDTAVQMEHVLHFGQRRAVTMRAHRSLLRRIKRRYEDDITLKVTNRLYAARRLRIKNRFSKSLRRIFGSDLHKVAFSRPRFAARLINRNVRKDTDGAINDLIEPRMLDSLTRLVIVNAVYFNGSWATPFDPEHTAPDTFNAPRGPLPVQMMQTSEPFAVGRVPALRARVLLLPYKGSKVHMMIILPQRKDGIDKLAEGLSKTSLAEVFQKAKVSRKFVVKLPKFHLDERIHLKRVLQAMGMTDLFDSVRSNLSRISRDEQLYATDAIHKAVIDVNEHGSEASAATEITTGFRTLTRKPPPFIVNRPFFFAIYDAGNDVTLFMGRVLDPGQYE